MTRFPQVLVNVPVPAVDGIAALVADEVKQAEERLADRGRVLIRPSGTESLVRVMVEAPTEGEAARSRTISPTVVARVGSSRS